MASWTSLALLSALAVSALSSPRPHDHHDHSAYKIPSVGTGHRSQYYVAHDDGTFKYGYDTGEGAFEAAKQKTPGHQHGKFGYRDPDGNNVRLEYQAGKGGFQATGTHIPVPSAEFFTAHAEANARPPFRDPLAQTNTDASYGFQFGGDGHSRTEQSDADGNVRGSYAYTDEQGRTRSYSYTAGSDTGFVIEGSDLPVASAATGETPAGTRLSSGVGAAYRGATAFRGAAAGATHTHGAGATSAAFRGAAAGATHTHGAGATSAAFRGAAAGATHTHGAGATSAAFRGAAAGATHGAGTASAAFGTSTTFGGQRTGFRRPAVTHTGGSAFRAATATGSTATRLTPATPQRHFSTLGATKYTGELANTRTSLGADGSRTFAYETSSHSRSEAEDSGDNVVGSFDFVAADDGQRRAIRYEAGSGTGFIAEGAHIPVGPAVPGAPSGQPTGRIVPVQQVHFVDPLADSNTDASYDFAFDSETYSRSETADADGNVRGSYTVVDDDGTRRTYNFRAGEGVGFETEEVSTSRGPRPSRPISAVSGTSFTAHGAAAPSPVISYKAPGSGRFSTSYKAGTSAAAGASTAAGSSYRAGTSATRGSSFRTGTSTHAAGTASRGSHSRVSPSRSSFAGTTAGEVFPGFQLHRYSEQDNRGKYGYVLKFDR